MYGYARVPLGADRRDKFVLIKWIGENVKPVQRAKAFDEVKQVVSFIKVRALSIHVVDCVDFPH